MTKTVRQKLLDFSRQTHEGQHIWVDDSDSIHHLTDLSRVDLDEWLEKQKYDNNKFIEGQHLVENVRRYKNLEKQ